MRAGIVFALVATACVGFPGAPNYCGRTIPGLVGSESDTQWGGDTAKVTATIKGVRAQCTRVDLTPDKIGRHRFEYRVSFRATVEASIIDTAFYRRAVGMTGSPFHGRILFFGMGEQLVPLDSAVADFKVLEGAGEDVADAAMTLNPDVMRDLVAVQVRWRYNR